MLKVVSIVRVCRCLPNNESVLVNRNWQSVSFKYALGIDGYHFQLVGSSISLHSSKSIGFNLLPSCAVLGECLIRNVVDYHSHAFYKVVVERVPVRQERWLVDGCDEVSHGSLRNLI